MGLVKMKHHIANNNRNSTIDFFKGLLIYLVVLGHTISGQYMNGISSNLEESLRFIIYLFHMPLFFFFSGYLIRTERLNRKYIFEKIKYTGIVFFVSSFVYLVIFSSISIKSIVFLITSPYNHLWFLEVLIIYFIVIYSFRNISYKTILLFSIILAILGTGFRDLGGTVFNQFGYKPIFRGMEYFIYFYFGYILRNELINFKLFQANKKALLLLFVAIFSLIIVNFQIDFLQINFYLSYSLGFVFFNILLILTINKFLNFKVDDSLITEGGRASLFIYLWHYGFIVVSLHVINKYWFSNLLIDILLSIFIFIVLVAINKLMSRYDYFKYLGAR